MYNFVACKVCYHVLVVTFSMPHDRGCEIKIIVIVIGRAQAAALPVPLVTVEWVSTRSFLGRMRGNQLAYSSHYKQRRCMTKKSQFLFGPM